MPHYFGLRRMKLRLGVAPSFSAGCNGAWLSANGAERNEEDLHPTPLGASRLAPAPGSLVRFTFPTASGGLAPHSLPGTLCFQGSAQPLLSSDANGACGTCTHDLFLAEEALS